MKYYDGDYVRYKENEDNIFKMKYKIATDNYIEIKKQFDKQQEIKSTSAAADIWRDVMKEVHNGLERKQFEISDDVYKKGSGYYKKGSSPDNVVYSSSSEDEKEENESSSSSSSSSLEYSSHSASILANSSNNSDNFLIHITLSCIF
jgi:membrane peptidoglycan carboxypeptidase